MPTSTVFSSYASNTLTGGDALDLFFGNQGPDATDRDEATETFVPVF